MIPAGILLAIRIRKVDAILFQVLVIEENGKWMPVVA